MKNLQVIKQIIFHNEALDSLMFYGSLNYKVLIILKIDQLLNQFPSDEKGLLYFERKNKYEIIADKVLEELNKKHQEEVGE